MLLLMILVIFIYIYNSNNIEGEIKGKILVRSHEINGKIVDVKPAVEGKDQIDEMKDATRKIFVGGLDPSVKNGIRVH